MGRGSLKTPNGFRYAANTYANITDGSMPAILLKSFVFEGREWRTHPDGVTESLSIKNLIRRDDKALSSLRQLDVLSVSDGEKLKFAAVSSQMVCENRWNCHLIGDRLCLSLDEAEALVSLEKEKIEAKGGDTEIERQFFDSTRRFLRDASGAGL